MKTLIHISSQTFIVLMLFLIILILIFVRSR
jgi:hypothetical protein